MEWVIIYWLAAKPDAPLYLAGTSFGSQEYCEEWAGKQDDWSRFQCAEADGGPTVMADIDTISGITASALATDATYTYLNVVPLWHPPLVHPSLQDLIDDQTHERHDGFRIRTRAWRYTGPDYQDYVFVDQYGYPIVCTDKMFDHADQAARCYQETLESFAN
jgi:hypothetical protein